ELLRQLGEEETALAAYRRAAEKLVAEGRDYLAAGNLMLHKAHHRDAALDYFRAGWADRPAANALPCALALGHEFAGVGDTGQLLALVDEADGFFAAAGNELSAGQFYNEIAKLSEREAVAAARADLRDRALTGLARKLRHGAGAQWRPGNLV